MQKVLATKVRLLYTGEAVTRSTFVTKKRGGLRGRDARMRDKFIVQHASNTTGEYVSHNVPLNRHICTDIK